MKNTLLFTAFLALVAPVVVFGHIDRSQTHMELHNAGFTHNNADFNRNISTYGSNLSQNRNNSRYSNGYTPRQIKSVNNSQFSYGNTPNQHNYGHTPNQSTTQNIIRVANPDGTITKRTITETNNHEFIERYEEPAPAPRVMPKRPTVVTYNDRYHGFGNYDNAGQGYGQYNNYNNGYTARNMYPTAEQNYSIMKVRQGRIANVEPHQEYITSPGGIPQYRKIVTPITNYDDYRYSAQKGSNRPDLQEAVRYLRTNRQMYDRFGHPRYEFLHDNDFDGGTYMDNYFTGEDHTHLRGDSLYDYEKHQHLNQQRITPSHNR